MKANSITTTTILVACLAFGCSSSSDAPTTTDDSGAGTDTTTVVDSASDTTSTDGSTPDTTSADTTVTDGAPSETSGDTSTTTDVAPDVPAGCTDITQQGTKITTAKIAGTAPTMKGGTIVDGTYVLTKREVYSASSGTGNDLAETIVLAGGVITEVQNDGGNPTDYIYTTFTTSGTAISFYTWCDSSKIFTGAWAGTYEATSTSFTYSNDVGGGRTSVRYYTKK